MLAAAHLRLHAFTMPGWYDPTFFLLHYDRQWSTTDHPQPLSGFDPDQVRRMLERVRPDAVTCIAKGHAGYVPYPTMYGNQLPALWDGNHPAPLHVYREITRELGIALVLGYSGLIDHRIAEERPEWLRVDRNGSPYPSRAICPNTGYVEELLLPQLDELIERYLPDGFWMDAENWTVAPCYCSTCDMEYRLQNDRAAPLNPSDPFWPAWLEFHRDSFERYVSRVARYLRERDTGLVYASNGAYTPHQPDRPPIVVDRLTRDLSPAYSLRQAGLEARFLDAQGVPFDLMTWSLASARPWPQGRLPALPSYPKTFEHLAQEGAAIMANGGRWSVWVSAYPDDSLPESQHEVVARAAQFARERQPWCQWSESGAYVAVLHSAATHRAAGNGLYDPGPSLDRVRGAHQALTELHHPHDVVHERNLPERLHRYRVIILPEQIALSPETDDVLREWVRGGGRLIASGRVAPRIIEDIPTFALEEVLGVRWTGSQTPDGYILHHGAPLQVGAPVYHVSPDGAEVIRPLLLSGRETSLQDSGYPAVTHHLFGEGAGCYIAADLFTAYHRGQYPGLRGLLADILELALPEPPLLTTAPPSVEVVLRRRAEQTLVHLVNHAPGKSLAQNSAFVEAVPPTAPFSLTLRVEARPTQVRLRPEDIEPEWSWSEGTLTLFVPPVHLHSVLVIE